MLCENFNGFKMKNGDLEDYLESDNEVSVEET